MLRTDSRVDCIESRLQLRARDIMENHIRNILFLCTSNSARSILAEALVNNLHACEGKFRAFSAGSFPVGRVNPFAIELLQSLQMKTEGLRSKSWDEFAGTDVPKMDFIVTVCDQAAGEQCPFWPGKPTMAHWGIPDPAAVSGDDEAKRRAFKDAFTVLRRRIELLASLPADKLSGLAIQDTLQEIGRQ